MADLDGTILALHRMRGATFFSVDVALAQSRNVIYFSSDTRILNDLPGVPPGTAVTNRTISFGGQPFSRPASIIQAPARSLSFTSSIPGTPAPKRPRRPAEMSNSCPD